VSKQENKSRSRDKTQSLAVALGGKMDPGAEFKLGRGLDAGNQKQVETLARYMKSSEK
jgi:hypothetical protein